MNIALGIILENKKVLIAKIKPEKVEDYGGLRYAFPSESIINIDKIEEELVAEVKKQSNLDIKIIQKIGERTHPLTGNHTYYFDCKVASNQPLIVPKEIDAESFIWVDIVSLSDYMPTLFDDVKNYLKEKVKTLLRHSNPDRKQNHLLA